MAGCAAASLKASDMTQTSELAPREFSAILVELGRALLALQKPGGLAVTAEDIAAKLDPAIAPEIMVLQVFLPLVGHALEILGAQSGVPGSRWLGAPRAP